MVLIAPSLLAADFGCLREQVALAEQGGADWIHLDVMDGHFVPNITFGPPLVKAVRACTRLPLDVHLMIEHPDQFLEAFREAGADRITVHVETCPHLNQTIHEIRRLGAEPGVCVNPATSLALLRDILPDVESVLVMSVNPGFGGQAFLPTSPGRIAAVKGMLQELHLSAHIAVDGGIDPQTASAVVAAGADVLIAGSAIFRRGDIPSAVRALRSAAGGSHPS